MNKEFVKATFYYSIGVLGTKVVMFAMVPLYSFFLSPSELGYYDLILISTTLITPLITLQVSDGAYRFLLDESNENRNRLVISSSLVVLIFGNLFFSILAFILSRQIEFDYIFEFILFQFSNSIFYYGLQVLRGLKQNKVYAIYGLLNACIVFTVSLILALLDCLTLKNIFYTLIGSQTLGFIYGVLHGRIYFNITPQIDRKLLKSIVIYSAPLLPNSISWWLIDLGNRFIILYFLNEEFNGIYAVAARYAGILALFNSVFILSWQDFAISKLETSNNKQENAKVFNGLLIFEMSLILLLSSLSNFIFRFSVGDEFFEAARYFPILLLSVALSSFCAFYGAFYLKDKNTIGVFRTTLAGGMANMLVSIALIEIIGLYAVAIGSVIGFATTWILRSMSFKLVVNFKVLIASLGLLVVILTLNNLNNTTLLIPLAGLFFIFFLRVNKALLLKANQFIFNNK